MKIVKSGILLFIVVALVSCVPPHALYLRNFLSSGIVVHLKFESKDRLDSWMRYHDKLSIRKNVSNFSKTADRLFRDTVNVVIIDPLVIQYTIPGRSVVEYGSSWYFDFVEMDIKGSDIDKKVYMEQREVVDNITGLHQKMELDYKWLGNYFFDIK